MGDPLGFRMDHLGDQEFFPAFDPLGHEHGFGDGRGPVVNRGVGHIHSRELADQGLEFKDGLERSLADLGLIGSIGRVKLRTPEI